MSENSDVPGLPISPETFPISPPIEFQGMTYNEIVLREPMTGEVLVGDMQLRSGVTQESLKNRQFHIMGKVAGVPVPVIQKLRVSQFNQMWSYLESFLSAGLPTGPS